MEEVVMPQINEYADRSDIIKGMAEKQDQMEQQMDFAHSICWGIPKISKWKAI